MPEIQYSYETLGNSSYLVATFAGGQGVINYQMQMLTNNDIKNIIKANKRLKNEDILISYNITSKISLEQVDSKNKISKAGMINIIEGALAALEDIEEYQLVSSGIVFDEKYIYVKPGTYEPSFVYLPCSIEDSGIEPVKQLLLSLIMGSKVEMTNDNFVQTLLDTLNKPGFSAKDLKKLCNDFKSGKTVSKQPERGQQSVQASVQQPVVQQPVQSPVQQQPVIQQPVQTPIQTPVQPPVMQPIPSAKGKEKPVKEKKQKNVKSEKTEANPKKNLFLILQLVLLGIIVAVSMSGILNNEDGSLNVTYLFGVVLALGAADFVLYREMFTNNKENGDEKKKEAKPAKNNAKKPSVSMPGKDIPARPAMPGKEIPKAPVKAPVNNIPQQPVQQEAPIAEQPVQQQIQIPVAQSIPQPTYVAPAQTQQYGQMSDFESEDTVVLDDNNADGAYLEYFENGLSTRIKLTKENFMIGKLRGQCDFVLNNNKISKMHAEFITRGTDYFVKDYNSTNGTYINGSNQRIASNAEYQIFNGDRITLANVDMTFRC